MFDKNDSNLDQEITIDVEALQKWIEQFKIDEKIRQGKKKEMMSNTLYIDWLMNFTSDKNKFWSDEYSYHQDELSEIDKENIKNLDLFYDGIADYSTKNYIYPTPVGDFYGNFYRVKYNDFSFKIGIMIGQGTVYSFEKEDLKDGVKFIDFNDVVNNKKEDNVDTINEVLDSFENMVISAYDAGVPIEALYFKFEDIIDSINHTEEDKNKYKIYKNNKSK